MERTKKDGRFSIDIAHEKIDVYREEPYLDGQHPIAYDIWKSKYRWEDGDEAHPHDSMTRVVEGVYAKDTDKSAKKDALEAMRKLLWLPAGRIQAGAGTPNIVTLLNCYMDRDIDDSMSGIADALKDAMLTMQQGGGIGMNFGTLRPAKAYLNRTGAEASGPLPFMNMWDSMCHTIMSAGGRRGAMMGVINDTHPDLVSFITAKHKKGSLTNFNLSVLISDAFIDALKHDEDWYLGFNVPRKDKKHLFVSEVETDDGIELWYAYSKWRAKDLWQLIMENTYEWSEPGVIFIDRINRVNNLGYCETITGTNPCGEQPLPPNGCCNLGAVNLARMVRNPFTEQADFEYHLLGATAKTGVRFLDNVIDVTLYPLDAQAREEYAKRRIGLGITGLANCLAQLGIRYGSKEAITATDSIMECLANAVYDASADLAKERGAFPLFDSSKWAAHSTVYPKLDPLVWKKVEEHGIRNGVLLTIAPTGTTSLYAGNVSSGLEPIFKHKAQRNIRQPDDTFKPYIVYDYNQLLLSTMAAHKSDALVEHDQVTGIEHVEMQAVCQKWVDASVSKTINLPKNILFEEFMDLYQHAYQLGNKGCTTYRPSDVRGSILSEIKDTPVEPQLLTRPDVLPGRTYKAKWPSVDENYYITINDVADKPFEVFIQSTSSKYADWTTALSLMISAIMRKGGDISFIPAELSKVKSAEDSAWVNGTYYSSLVALIGDTIGTHFKTVGILDSPEDNPNTNADSLVIEVVPEGEFCPQCGQPTIYRAEGCDKCSSCDYSRCG